MLPQDTDTTAERRLAVERRAQTMLSPSVLGLNDRRRAPRRIATDALKMACPYCGASESAVVKSRGTILADSVRRRRECANCSKRFPTSETVDWDLLDLELASSPLPAADEAARSGSSLT